MIASTVANELTCNISDAVIKCVLPVQESDIWDKASTVGTLTAAGAAVAFGIWAEIKAIRERKRAERAEANLRIQTSVSGLVGALSDIADSQTMEQIDVSQAKDAYRLLQGALLARKSLDGSFTTNLGNLCERLFWQLERWKLVAGAAPRDGTVSTLSDAQIHLLRRTSRAIRSGVSQILLANNRLELRRAENVFHDKVFSVEELMHQMEGSSGV